MTPPLRRDFLKTSGLMFAASGLGLFSDPKIALSMTKSSATLSDAPRPINDKDRREREARAKNVDVGKRYGRDTPNRRFIYGIFHGSKMASFGADICLFDPERREHDVDQSRV